MEEEEDPFGEIAQLGDVSSSQESPLRRCGFVGQVSPPASHDKDENCHNLVDIPDDIPGDSTPIILESPPDSPDDGCTHLEDLFHTPPEGSPSSNHGEDDRTLEVGRNGVEGAVLVDSRCAESLPAVDLGRDTDSEEEVELTQRIEARVSKSESSPAERSVREPSSKRLKISGCSEAVQEISKEEFLNSSQKSKSRVVSPSPREVSASLTEKDRTFPDPQTLKLENQRIYRSRDEVPEKIHTSNATLVKSSNKLKGKSTASALRFGYQNVEDEIRDFLEKLDPKYQQSLLSRGQISEGQSSKRLLNCPTEVIDTESRNAGITIEIASGGEKKEIEDIDRFRYTGQNDAKLREHEKEARGKRLLPPSISSTMEAAKSPINATKRAEAPASSNATQVATTSATNAQGAAKNASGSIFLNKQASKLKALGDVLKAMSEYDKKGDDLIALSLMDIVRNRAC